MCLSTHVLRYSLLSPAPLPSPVPKISSLSFSGGLGDQGRDSWDSASKWTCSSALLFKDRHYKNVVCWLKQFVCLISQSSVRSFCHLSSPCVFCIFQRIASFQQHLFFPLEMKHVLRRNFPLSRSNFLTGASAHQSAMLYFFPLQFGRFWASTMSCIQSFWVLLPFLHHHFF